MNFKSTNAQSFLILWYSVVIRIKFYYPDNPEIKKQVTNTLQMIVNCLKVWISKWNCYFKINFKVFINEFFWTFEKNRRDSVNFAARHLKSCFCSRERWNLIGWKCLTKEPISARAWSSTCTSLQKIYLFCDQPSQFKVFRQTLAALGCTKINE